MTALMTAKELMSKLDEDILITDPAYQKIIATLENYHASFNPIKNSQQEFQLLQQINQSLYQAIEKNTDPAPQAIRTLLTSVQQRCIALANIPALQQTVPKNLHFIWLGQLGKIQQDYIKAWGETNKGQQGYRIKIWYDPNALLVYPLAKHIKDFAAKNTFIGEIDWVDKVIQLQNQAYSEITQALKNNQTFDQAALDFICRRLGGSRENLEHIMADNQASFNNFIANAGSDYILQDINTVLDQGIDKKYYYQELALRQNTAAASDLLRLQILNQQGGVYFDVDFLPQWKPDLFNTGIITEMKRLQEGNIALLQTQLVLEHLQADFPARTALAEKGQYQDYVAIFAKRSADHATLVDKMRICIRNKGHSPRDFFQALAPQKILPDGLRRAKIFFTGSNAGIVAPANSASLTTLMQYITNNYHRLEDLDLVDIQQYTDINQEKILGYAHQFKHDYGSGSDDFDATPAVNYRLDGLLPEARATISISGPGAVTQGLKKLSQRWFDSDPRVSFDQDLFEQFNGSTEEDRTHSWLTTTSSSLQGKFRRVMSRDDLLKIIPMSFIKTGYQPILMTLDKLHNTRGIEKTQTAFILKNQLRDYIAKQPDPQRNAAFSKLVDQLNSALFSADMAHFKTVINDIAATRPALANQLYLYAFNEAHGDNLGLTDAMIRAVQTDPYLHLQPKSRFSGASPPINLADFASTYQVKLTSVEDFAEFKRLLLHAQDQHILNKVFLDDREKTIHLGYHYQELIEPQPNARAQQAMDYLQSAIAKIRDNQDAIWPDAEFFMLAKFGDKNYIDNLQLERLADIKAIYQADHAWEKPLVIKINNGGDSHYQSQIIIQLEDDRYCVNAAASLASKHRNSVFVQLNNKGDYRVVYGDPTQLSGKIRWQLVGHGGGGSFSDQHRMGDTMVDTMADTTAQALAIRLTHFNRKFSAQYGVNSAANYISLVGGLLSGSFCQRSGTTT